MVLAQCFSWGYTQDVSRVAVIWRGDWSWGIIIPGGSLTQLLAEFFHSALGAAEAVSFTGQPGNPSTITAVFLQGKWLKRKSKKEATVLLWLNLWSHTSSFYSVRNKSLFSSQSRREIKLHLLTELGGGWEISKNLWTYSKSTTSELTLTTVLLNFPSVGNTTHLFFCLQWHFSHYLSLPHTVCLRSLTLLPNIWFQI